MKKWFAFCLCGLWLMASGAALSENPLTPDISPEKEDAFVFAPLPSDGETEGGSPAVGNETHAWTYPIARALLQDPLDVLRNVNKENLLEKDYPPEDDSHKLISVTVRKASGTDIQAREVASSALEDMFAAAEAEGIMLYLKSGYRSYRTQEVMHYNRVQSKGRDDGVVQAAGASDHQTGLGFDVVSYEWRDRTLNEDFAATDEGRWMAANCASYGFIIRYPEGKEDITGIIYEPWHLRYVGIEVAQYVTAQGLTLEEFTAEWQAALTEYEDPATPQASSPDADMPETGDGGEGGGEDSLSF